MKNPTPQDLITRSEIEFAIRKCKQGKAAGHDGIPAEYYKKDPSRMARMLVPLSIKQSGLLCEPYQYKGGEAKDLLKSGQSKPQNAEAHRSVLLADNIGKIFRGAARPRLVKHAVKTLLQTQCGGLPGRSTELPAHMARAFIERCRRKKTHGAILFVDAKSAFYAAAAVAPDPRWAREAHKGHRKPQPAGLSGRSTYQQTQRKTRNATGRTGRPLHTVAHRAI